MKRRDATDDEKRMGLACGCGSIDSETVNGSDLCGVCSNKREGQQSVARVLVMSLLGESALRGASLAVRRPDDGGDDDGDDDDDDDDVSGVYYVPTEEHDDNVEDIRAIGKQSARAIVDLLSLITASECQQRGCERYDATRVAVLHAAVTTVIGFMLDGAPVRHDVFCAAADDVWTAVHAVVHARNIPASDGADVTAMLAGAQHVLGLAMLDSPVRVGVKH